MDPWTFQSQKILFVADVLALTAISRIVAAFPTAILVIRAVVVSLVAARGQVSSTIAGAVGIAQSVAAILVLILALRILLAGIPLVRVLRPLVLGHGGLDRHRECSCEPCA